jgi:molybdopterin molybdotransferase
MTTSLSQLVTDPSCMDDYDPNSMPVAKAREYIRQFLTPVRETETVALRQSLGRILAQDLLSPANVPNYDNSAMDGYAFNADSLAGPSPHHLNIVGTAFAGKAFIGNLASGECVRIMTGGMLPAQTNTVVIQEKVKVLDGVIELTDVPKRGANVRYAGEDLSIGQTVLSTGHLMQAADLGLIASLGIANVKVYRTLKVAFFSTGDELVSVDQPLQSGQVYDSNRYTLFGMLSRLGVELIDLGAIPDQPEVLEQTLLNAARQADAIITSGGVSVGEADYMKQLLEKHGQVLFWKIAMKPGRPLAYGKVGNAHYFGLPGNPVAVMVTFYQFVREALMRLMGQHDVPPLPMFTVPCASQIKKLTGRTEFQRGIVFADTDGTLKVKTTGPQGSAILSSMSLANCFIVLDETVGNVEIGCPVQVQMLNGII